MKGEKGFDDAEKHMQEAEGDLKGDQGEPGEGGAPKPGGQSGGKGAAVDAQGRALEALREGAQGMQKQMGQGQGPEQREGQRIYRAPGPTGRAARATIRSAAAARATWAARTARSGRPSAAPNAPAACSRSCAAASPIRTARSRSATISNG